MTKSNLYTRTGDAGTTSLVGGQRVAKASPRLDAYGTVDEFSATLALILTHSDCPPQIRTELQKVQNTLFNIGSYLATDSPEEKPAQLRGLSQEQISELEQQIDTLDSQTPAIHCFILPGGTQISAFAHLSRTVCRRAERMILRLDALQKVDPLVLQYFNRLSDYFFILSRYLNHEACTEELVWNP